MAKMFLTPEEAASLLVVAVGDLASFVRTGQLREFRDAGSVNYKADEVRRLAEKRNAARTAKPGEEVDDEILLTGMNEADDAVHDDDLDALLLEDIPPSRPIHPAYFGEDDCNPGATALNLAREMSTLRKWTGIPFPTDCEKAATFFGIPASELKRIAGSWVSGS